MCGNTEKTLSSVFCYDSAGLDQTYAPC